MVVQHPHFIPLKFSFIIERIPVSAPLYLIKDAYSYCGRCELNPEPLVWESNPLTTNCPTQLNPPEIGRAHV